MSLIKLNGIDINVTRKRMRSLRLTVKMDGSAWLSVPLFASNHEIESFLLSRQEWLIATREKMLQRKRPQPRKYEDGEMHWLLGDAYPLRIIESKLGPAITLKNGEILLFEKPGAHPEAREGIMKQWYRKRLETCIASLINVWGVQMKEENFTWSIRQMKARWGSCCPAKRSMLFNLDLCRMPLAYIEYVVVHELTHLKEASHNARFKNLMTQALPEWPKLKKELNLFAQTKLNP